jgi:hypothetical protein
MVGIGRDYELPLPHAKQIVFAHEPIDPFPVHCPAAAAQFLRGAPPSVTRPFQRDPLDRIAQIHI